MMKMKQLILPCVTIFFLLEINLFANLYEGFDFSGKKGLSLGQEGSYAGETSEGWMSSWQIGSGDALVSKKDISFKGLKSTGGSFVLKGERKNQNFFAKGYAIRQSKIAYEGDVYGSFRVIPGFITEDTVISMVLHCQIQQKCHLGMDFLQ